MNLIQSLSRQAVAGFYLLLFQSAPPGEGLLNSISQFITGPFGKAITLIAIVLCGCGYSRRDSRDVGRREEPQNLVPECSFWAAGARPIRIPARANALLLRKDATGFRALSLKPASLLRKAQASLPVPRSHRGPAGQGQSQNPRGGQLRNGLRALGQNRFRCSPPALPRPTGGLFAQVPSLMNKAASRSRCALKQKHRIGRVWGRSLRYRSLGLALASAVTGSVSAGALPSPCFAWGLRITALRPWGACAIRIFAPAVGIKPGSQKQSQAEEARKKPTKGKKTAEPAKQTEPQPETQLLGFRGVYVFDVSMTGGEPLKDSRQPVDVADKLDKLTAFAQTHGMTIEYVDWLTEKKGNSYRGTIRLLPNMPPAESFPVLLREVASQLLYTIKRRTFVTRDIHQQETKAAAFVVCEALGLESKTAFSDCQLYYGDSRLLSESLAVVHRTAAVILGTISPEIAAPANSKQAVN